MQLIREFVSNFLGKIRVVNSYRCENVDQLCNTLCKLNSTCFLDWMLHAQNHSHSQNKIIWQFKGNIMLSYHRFHVCSRLCLLYVSLNEKALLTVPSYLFLHFRPFSFEKSCFHIIVVIPIKARENCHITLIEDSSDQLLSRPWPIFVKVTATNWGEVWKESISVNLKKLIDKT